MEKTLFTWTDYDQFDTAGFVFMNVQLIASVGMHPPGAQFDYANMDYDKATLTLGRDKKEWKYPLTLQIGQLLT